MTTIAYHHKSKQIAFDSRSCSGGTIMTDSAIKMDAVGGVAFVFAGCISDKDALIDMYFSKCQPKRADCSAIAIDGGVAYKCGVTEDGEFWRQRLTNDDAIGSGWQHALSAMDFGLDAVGAVKHAAKRDCYTGGIIRVYDIELGDMTNDI